MSDLHFNELQQQISRTEECATKSRLIADLYALAVSGSLTYAPRKMDSCHRATIDLMEQFRTITHPDERTLIGVCRCLSEYFYPEAMEDQEWFRFFQQTIESWAETLSEEGTWAGLPEEIVLERLELMNRNSDMFLDHRFDDKIRRAEMNCRISVVQNSVTL